MGWVRKCSKGYKIEKGEADTKKMEYYAKAIRKVQQELKTSGIPTIWPIRSKDAPRI